MKSDFWNRAVKSGAEIIKDCEQEIQAPNIQNIVSSAIEEARELWILIEEVELETSEAELSNNRYHEPRYVPSLAQGWGAKTKTNLTGHSIARGERQRDTRPTNPANV